MYILASKSPRRQELLKNIISDFKIVVSNVDESKIKASPYDLPLELSKDNNQYCKISVFMPNAGSINESVISVTNVGGYSFSVAVSMIRWNTNKVFCKLINGTKISNINMYYTVDTDRFCFYIKANWYAKIVVSRLGLVNTSKIESINAIPSEAIEVPIY